VTRSIAPRQSQHGPPVVFGSRRGPRSPADTGRTAFPLEHLAPYMRGINFALEAISERVAEDERLQREAVTYRAIAQDSMKHGLATLKLRESMTK